MISKEVYKIVINEVVPRMNKKNLSFAELPFSQQNLYDLINLKYSGKIDHKRLREILDTWFKNTLPK